MKTFIQFQKEITDKDRIVLSIIEELNFFSIEEKKLKSLLEEVHLFNENEILSSLQRLHELCLLKKVIIEKNKVFYHKR